VDSYSVDGAPVSSPVDEMCGVPLRGVVVSMGSASSSELDIVLEAEMFEWAECGVARWDDVRFSSREQHRTSAFIYSLKQNGDCFDDTASLLYLLLHQDKRQSNDTWLWRWRGVLVVFVYSPQKRTPVSGATVRSYTRSLLTICPI
jgi:hypothetical protein